MTFPYGETVTRLRAATSTDPYSNETVADWSLTPSEFDIDGCGVASGGSLEPVEVARNAVDSDFDVVAPFDADVTAQDRLRIRGLVCDVVGRPFAWRHPMTGWEAGVVIKAKIREG